MHLSRIIIFTPNVKRLAEFYANSFALTPIGEITDAWAELDAGGCSIALHAIDEHSPIREGWIKVVFGAGDVRAEKERLESLGVEMSDMVEFDGIHLCDGRDPDGNDFQISSRGL